MINHYCKHLINSNRIIICNEFAEFLRINKLYQYMPTRKKIILNSLYKYFLLFRIDWLIGALTILITKNSYIIGFVLLIIFIFDLYNSKKVIFKKKESYLYERKKRND